MDILKVQRFVGEKKVSIVQDHTATAVSLLPGPVVFLKKPSKNCLPIVQSNRLKLFFFSFFFYVGDTRGSFVTVSMSAADRRVKTQSSS